MPLFMDRHEVPGATAQDVADAHPNCVESVTHCDPSAVVTIESSGSVVSPAGDICSMMSDRPRGGPAHPGLCSLVGVQVGVLR